MEFTILGKTDLSISRVGFGCWAIGGHGYGKVDDSDSMTAVHAALDAGINFFDTSDVYGLGHSETVLVKALGTRAKDVVIATKFGVRWDELGRTHRDCSPAHIVRAVESSLRRLKLDCIPLYQLNWYDGVTPLERIIETLEGCRAAGKIRYLGFSNMNCLEWGNHLERFESSQIPYSLNDSRYSHELSHIASAGLSALVYGVLSRGLFSGRYDLRRPYEEGDTRARDPNFSERLPSNLALLEKLKVLAAKYRRTAGQVAIRWVLDHPASICALVGMKTRDQVLENVDASGWRLEPEDWNWLGGSASAYPV